MDRIDRFGGLPLLALVALGCGGGGGVKYVAPTINFDARPDDAPSDKSVFVAPGPTDGSTDVAPDGSTNATDAAATDGAADLLPCPFGGAVPIYCSGGSVYEPSPLIACIGGGHVYGSCPNGCATGMVMGPVADPLAVLCSGTTDGATGVDAAADGEDARDAGTEM